MNWPGPIVEAQFIKRYKRFLADFELPGGNLITAHCANTGTMSTCLRAGARAWLTHHDDPKRKLKYSWQAIEMQDGWVGINTALANRLVAEAIENNVIKPLQGYRRIVAEQRYGRGSRIDLLLKHHDNLPDCFVEVKNVTLLLDPGVAGFPDAVTKRGTKHIKELCTMLAKGHRAALVYCVQRNSVSRMAPAEAYDPEYTETLHEAAKRGLEIYAYKAELTKDNVLLGEALPVELTGALG